MATVASTHLEPIAPEMAVGPRASSSRRRGRGSLFWLGNAAFWGFVFAVNMLLVSVFAVDDPWWFVLTEISLCFLATAGMRWLSHDERLLERIGLSKIGVIAGGGLLAAVLITLLLLVVGRVCGLPRPTRPEVLARAVITLTMLANWSAVYFGSQLIRERNTTEIRALRAESLALRHELRHLQAQISPHFLFNALNAVQACRHDPEAIATLTQALAAYLRFLLQPAAVLEPLSRELDALEEYFTIQEVRFGDGLETRIDCDFAARGLLVPPLLVQPLVENAIKYGGQTAPLPIRVHVGVRLTGDWLEVEVANAGRWVAPGGAASTGTGLPSLERRLQLLLGPTSSVSHREEDGWVRVLVWIPARPAPATAFPGAAT